MKYISIVLLFALVTNIQGVTKCGSAAWWTDIKANLMDKWDTTDAFVKNFNTLKSAYDQLDASTVTATHEVSKGHCKPFFTVDTDKSCCSSADHSKLINLAVKASIAAAIPRGKGDACQSLKFSFQKAMSECNQAKNAAAKSSSSSSSTSTNSTSANITITPSIASGSASKNASNSTNSSNVISSSSSTGVPESVQKIQDKAQQAGRKSEAKSKKALGDAALAIAQQLRGTLCVLCGDPDKKSSLFDPANQTWFVNKGGMDDFIVKVAQAYNETAANGKDCLDYIVYNQKRYEKAMGSCEGAAQVIEDYQAQLTPCQTDADCQQIAGECFNPLTTDCVTKIVSNTTVSARRMMLKSQKRILAGPAYSTSSTGGSTSVSNPTEDGAIVVGGESITTINQQATTAEADYQATGGGTMNYDEALQAESGFSSLLNFILVLSVVISLFI